MAHRRYSLSIRDAADLVSVPVTVKTYHHLSEYASLMDIHEAEQQSYDRQQPQTAPRRAEQAMTDHPELWAFYQRAKHGD